MAMDEIFSRERLAGYNPELMSQSVALVAGAGALGQNTAMNLALAGVGEIRIVDKDHFEKHNLTRSPAYPTPEEQELLGLGKARAVASKLRRLMTAPNSVMRYAHNWIQELGDGAFKGVSVVLSCVDSQRARAYLSDKARLHGLPFIEGGFSGPNIALSSYPPTTAQSAAETPCWRCSHPNLGGSFSCRDYARKAEAEGIIPAIQSAAATLGGLQAEAAILALHKPHDAPNEARAVNLDVRTAESQRVRLSTDPWCSERRHHALGEEPVRLEISSSGSVEQLLAELSERMSARVSIDFYSADDSLVWVAPCTACKMMASARRPYWSWEIDPRCLNCQKLSDHAPAVEDVGTLIRYEKLSLKSNPEVLKADCRQIGLPPLALVKARAEGGRAKFFELAGSLDDLFMTGEIL